MNQHDPESPTTNGVDEPNPWARPAAPPTAPAAHRVDELNAWPTAAPVPAAPVVFRAEPKRRGGPSAFAVIFTLAALLCVGGVAFAAGRLTAPASAAGGTGTNGADAGLGNGRRFPNASPGASFVPGGGGFGGGAVSVEGTVTTVGADGTITLQTANGGTVEITTDGQTTYHAESGSTASAVTAGTTVRVQISRAGFGGGFGGGPTASGAPTAQAATDVLIVTP